MSSTEMSWALALEPTSLPGSEDTAVVGQEHEGRGWVREALGSVEASSGKQKTTNLSQSWGRLHYPIRLYLQNTNSNLRLRT